MPDVAVCRDEHVKTSGFGRIEEFAISQRVPSARAGLLDPVCGQGSGNAPRRPGFEEDTHQRPDTGASRLLAAKLENGLDLFPRYGKLPQHFVDGHAVFQVLEDDRHRRASALEHPGAADLARNALNRRTAASVLAERAH